MIYINDYESPLGNILLAGDEQGLTGLWFTEGGRYIGLGLKKGASRREMDYFDQKTSSWIATPDEIRSKGGALFCERRYDAVFTFHNGADSYYSVRGWRGYITL